MSKFYVQCGPVRVVISASCSEQAAIAGLDKTLTQHLWIYDDQDLSYDDCRTHLMLESLLHLDPVVRVSERGFDRSDADQIGTPETVDQWHRLMTGMSRLFVAAGLTPRSMCQVGGQPATESRNPGLPR